MKRFYAMIVALIGVAILVMGILFTMQANTAKQKVSDEIAPVTLSTLNATYDQVKAAFNYYYGQENTGIQTKTAAPSATYDYYIGQRALLGLAKSNVATAGFILMSGVVEIVLGIGLILTGMVLYMKPKE